MIWGVRDQIQGSYMWGKCPTCCSILLASNTRNIIITHTFPFWFTPSSVQGLVLASHSVITPGRLGKHMECQGSSLGQPCVRQEPYLHYYSIMVIYTVLGIAIWLIFHRNFMQQSIKLMGNEDWNSTAPELMPSTWSFHFCHLTERQNGEMKWDWTSETWPHVEEAKLT